MPCCQGRDEEVLSISWSSLRTSFRRNDAAPSLLKDAKLEAEGDDDEIRIIERKLCAFDAKIQPLIV